MENTQKIPYTFLTLAGTPYELGQQQGAFLKHIAPYASYMTSTPEEWSASYYPEVEALYRGFCPELLEEVQGLADELGVAPGKIMYNCVTYLVPPHCGHVALLPKITANRHTLVGRSYEFGIESNDNCLFLTRPAGKYSHIGCSSVILGRLDGMNDQGLVVTMSAGGIPVGPLPGLRPAVQKGLQFWAVIRSILENCRNVDEGLALIKQAPFCGNPILILADSAGKAAKAEIYGPTIRTEEIDRNSAKSFLCATNHFVHPDMEQYSSPARRNSTTRYQRFETLAQDSGKPLDKEDVRKALSTLYPDGLCCHFYKEYFGTMYSLIFDPMQKELEICFGSPVVNGWHTFTLDEQAPVRTFEAILPQAEGFKEFWEG